MKRANKINLFTVVSVQFWLMVSTAAAATTVPAKKEFLTGEEASVVKAVAAMFDAMKANDPGHFHLVVQPDFYIFDSGKRLDANGVLNLIRQLEVSGKKYEWHITDPDVHVEKSVAWVAYTNKGSVSDRSGTTPREWLESAFLVKQGGQWKISFVHSTPVPKS